MKIGDVVFNTWKMSAINYNLCFVQFQDIKTGYYFSKTFKELAELGL